MTEVVHYDPPPTGPFQYVLRSVAYSAAKKGVEKQQEQDEKVFFVREVFEQWGWLNLLIGNLLNFVIDRKIEF